MLRSVVTDLEYLSSAVVTGSLSRGPQLSKQAATAARVEIQAEGRGEERLEIELREMGKDKKSKMTRE